MLVWVTQACANDYALTPDYYLTGALDLLYISEKTAANGTETAADSLRKRYSLGLNGPVIGPLIGMFTLNGNLSQSSVSTSTTDLSAGNYSLSGTADLFPTGKLRFSLYYDMTKASSDSLGLHSSSDSDSYGITFNPRLFRGTTLLTYDHSDFTGGVAQRTSFNETRDRGTLFYSDSRRFRDESRLNYQYQAALLEDKRNNQGNEQSIVEMDNRFLASYYKKIDKDTQWSNSLSGDYASRSGNSTSGVGSYGSALFESSLTHDFSRDVRGFLTLNHVTRKTPETSIVNTELLTATGLYSNVPNPVPKLGLNLQASLGLSNAWENNQQSLNGSATAVSRWSGSRFFDVLNDLAYSYQTGTSADVNATAAAPVQQNGSAAEAVDALAYRFGLQGKGAPFNWYSDYTFQQLGLFTAPLGAGTNRHLLWVSQSPTPI